MKPPFKTITAYIALETFDFPWINYARVMITHVVLSDFVLTFYGSNLNPFPMRFCRVIELQLVFFELVVT